MEVVGKIKRIEAEIQHSETFKSRDVVMLTEEQYPQTLKIQFVQGNVSLLDNYKADDKVKIAVNLRGKEFEKDGKPVVYNTTVGWKIERLA